MDNDIEKLIRDKVWDHLDTLSTFTATQRDEISSSDSINIIWGILLADYKYLIITRDMVWRIYHDVVSNYEMVDE